MGDYIAPVAGFAHVSAVPERRSDCAHAGQVMF
jgi:hypothetical protein